MNIKIIKLVNGDEIICDLEETKTKLKVNKPLLLAFQENRLVFVPFMQYTTAMEGFELLATSVLFVTDPVDSLVNDYQMADLEKEIELIKKSDYNAEAIQL